MPYRISVVAGALVGAVALAGCSSITPGSAQPTGESSSTGTSSSGTGLLGSAPQVANPLDTTKFHQVPCSVLTPAQLQAFNIGRQGKTDTAGSAGPDCSWFDDQGPSAMDLSVTFLTAGHGLSSLYGNRSSYGVFEPLPDIESYPAVIAVAGQDDPRPRGKCIMGVGVTDKLLVQIQVSLSRDSNKPADFADPCPRAVKVATEVMKTLKGGS